MTTHYGTHRRVGVNERRHLEKKKTARQAKVGQYGKGFLRAGWKWMLLICVLGLASWGGFLAFERVDLSKLLVLKRVQVDGNRLLAWENLMAKTGLEIGVSMFDIPVDSVQSKLMTLDLVKNAQVTRKWPSTLKIAIEEAKPLFLLAKKNGLVVWSDKSTAMPEGIELGLTLPVVNAEGTAAVNSAVKILNTMKDADPGMYGRVSQVVVGPQSSWVEVFFRDVNHKVLFSVYNGNSQVFSQYRLLVKGLSSRIRNAAIIDMRFHGMAVAVPAGQEKNDG